MSIKSLIWICVLIAGCASTPHNTESERDLKQESTLTCSLPANIAAAKVSSVFTELGFSSVGRGGRSTPVTPVSADALTAVIVAATADDSRIEVYFALNSEGKMRVRIQSNLTTQEQNLVTARVATALNGSAATRAG